MKKFSALTCGIALLLAAGTALADPSSSSAGEGSNTVSMGASSIAHKTENAKDMTAIAVHREGVASSHIMKHDEDDKQHHEKHHKKKNHKEKHEEWEKMEHHKDRMGHHEEKMERYKHKEHHKEHKHHKHHKHHVERE